MPLGPCAKRRVVAVLVVGDQFFIGENSCDHAERVCPRRPGEGYDACKIICAQRGHAEIMAIQEALKATKRSHLAGSMIYLFGHEKPCPTCEAKLQELGISWQVLHVGKPALSALL